MTEEVIGCALKVHETLGTGFLESVYESALAWELEEAGISFNRQARLPVWYGAQKVGEFVSDFIVEDQLIIELKALQSITSVCEAQLLNYLRASNKNIGLILNFGNSKLQVKRKVWNYDENRLL